MNAGLGGKKWLQMDDNVAMIESVVEGEMGNGIENSE